MRPRAALLVTLGVLAAALPPLGLDPVAPAEASHAVELMAATLPGPRTNMGIAAAGPDSAFLLGGWDGNFRSQVVRYDQPTNRFTVAANQLPTARYLAAAAGDASGIYLFGGYSGALLDQVVRFTPATGAVTALAARLPSPRYYHAAVWDGSAAYIFGGYNGTFIDQVVRFHPVTGFEVLPVRLPEPRAAMGAVWDGTYAYLVGGYNGAGYFDSILRFDPVTLNISTLGATLPRPTLSVGAVWGDGFIYVFGGSRAGGPTADIVRIDPVGDDAVVVASLPSVDGAVAARTDLSGVWLHGRAYLFGGMMKEALEFDPTIGRIASTNPLLPTGVDGNAGAYAGGLAWSFGGSGTQQVAGYDPVRNVVRSAAPLPNTVTYGTAVSDGTTAYILGGHDYGRNARSDQVFRFHAPTGTVSVMAARLPETRSHATAVWAGDRAYVFGGIVGPSSMTVETDRIVRYVPATDSVTTMPTRLPATLELPASVWDERDRPADGCPGGCAFIFGGVECATTPGCRFFDDILRYNPTTGAIDRMGAHLPTSRYAMSAVWDGRFAYILGGYSPDQGLLRDIVRYDPLNDTIAYLGAKLPEPRFTGAASFDGQRIVYMGGVGSRQVYSYDLRVEGQLPPVPLMRPVPRQECLAGRAIVALDGSDSYDPNGDAINLSWNAPNTVLANATAARTNASFPLFTTQLRLTVRDAFASADNVQPVQVVDSFPPVTSARLMGTPGTNGWWRSAVRADLAGSDACGVDFFESCCDGGGWVRGNTTNVTGDLVHRLYFRATDLGRNVERYVNDTGIVYDYRWVDVPIDTAPPRDVTLTEPRAGVAYLDDRPLLTDLSPPALLPQEVCQPYVGCRAVPTVPFEGLPPEAFAPLAFVLTVLNDSALVIGNQTLRATAEDDLSGIAYVQFGLDGTVLGNDTEAPYSMRWEAGREAAGNHTLWARAVDVAGNEARSERSVYTLPTTPAGLIATAQCTQVLSPEVCTTLEQVQIADLQDALDTLERNLPSLFQCEAVLSEANCRTLLGGG